MPQWIVSHPNNNSLTGSYTAGPRAAIAGVSLPEGAEPTYSNSGSAMGVGSGWDNNDRQTQLHGSVPRVMESVATSSDRMNSPKLMAWGELLLIV